MSRGNRSTWKLGLIFGFTLLAVLVTGCRRPQMMADQPQYDPLEPSAFYADGMSSRPRIAGTVHRGAVKDGSLLYTGREGGEYSDTFPLQLTESVMKRGQERYDIYCSMCHGGVGLGDGMIVARGYRKPPSFHTDQLRARKNGYLFDVITNGFGAMPAYGTMIPVQDRWAIVAYLRALQLSQNATLADVPTEDRGKLDGSARTETKPAHGTEGGH